MSLTTIPVVGILRGDLSVAIKRAASPRTLAIRKGMREDLVAQQMLEDYNRWTEFTAKYCAETGCTEEEATIVFMKLRQGCPK